ncbi:hypothetical protein B0H12DRAFT_1061335, partial [Mycena haematopus]
MRSGTILTNAYAYPPPSFPIAMRTSTRTTSSASPAPSRSSTTSPSTATSTSAIPEVQAQAQTALTLRSWASTGSASSPDPNTKAITKASTSTKANESADTQGVSVRRRMSRVFSRLRTHTHSKTRHGRSRRTPSQSPSPRRVLPSLPAELWILILEYSTYPSSPEFDSPLSISASTACALPSLELPSSFLSPALTPASLAPRLAYYRTTMAHKRALALVSKEWNGYAQPVLYSAIWITRAAQAKALALTLLCQACCLPPAPPRSSTSSSASYTGPISTSHTDASVGRFIRRLHIETPALARCAPADLRAILAYAPGLEVYSDFRSVRLRPPGAPAELLGALARGGALKRLSWTNYDDPALYLELNFVSSAVSPSPSHSGVAKERELLEGTAAAALALSLPALKTLKVALDNATFAVLSTWDLPALRNLSVLSADFSYAREGFRRFFAVHGKGLRQLELGHSSAHIEEHYLTAPPAPVGGGGAGGGGGGMSLAEWCPHLEEFVCSADAAWDWTHPDWIAPHLLLPAHPTVTLIGIRGTDARLRDDYARRAQGQEDADEDEDDDDAFFGLRAQVETLLRREAFPRLKYVRDLSEGSDAMRRGRAGLSLSRGSRGEGGRERERRERERVVRFWEGVLGRCREEGVWLEDWRGWNVT